jgi:uncharacterized HAD superfamily protein
MARIGIDIDGVLANFNQRYARVMYDAFGVDSPERNGADPKDWNWHYAAGLTPVQEAACYQIMETAGHWQSLQPLFDDYTKGLIQGLVITQDVYFITSRPADWYVKRQTERWLQEKLHIHTRPVTCLITHDKPAVAKALDLTHFIEDKPSTLLAMPNGVTSFLIAHAYNEGIYPSTIFRGTLLDSIHLISSR